MAWKHLHTELAREFAELSGNMHETHTQGLYERLQRKRARYRDLHRDAIRAANRARWPRYKAKRKTEEYRRYERARWQRRQAAKRARSRTG